MKINYPAELTPANVQELITLIDDTDNRVVARKARKAEDTTEFKPGLIQAVKKAIQQRNKANGYVSRPASEGRMDTLLRTRDSNGKATARK